MYPTGHWQMGLWLTTWHLALEPHTPGQGSTHFWLMQAVVKLHSELMIHSGLQFGGLPEKLGWQEQTQAPFISLFWLLGPQGSGSQGFSGTTGSVNTQEFVSLFVFHWFYMMTIILTVRFFIDLFYCRYVDWLEWSVKYSLSKLIEKLGLIVQESIWRPEKAFKT